MMPSKLNYEYVRQVFAEKGYTLISKEYTRNNQKLVFMDDDGYTGETQLANLQYGKEPRLFSKFNSYTCQNIQKFLDKAGEGVVLLSTDFPNSAAKLRFRCSCGKEFERSWQDLSTATYTVCGDCALVKRGITRRKSWNDVQRILCKAGYSPTRKEYSGNNQRIECTDKDGYKGFVTYNGVLQGKGMARFDRRSNDKWYVYNINHWAKINDIKATVVGLIDDGRWSHQGISCVCECGAEFETSRPSFMNGKTRCDACARSISAYEDAVIRWLDFNGVEYCKQKTFPDCKRKIVLPFDFYLTDTNTLIEIDGQGHYHPAYFHNCSREKAEESFRLIQESDKIKNDYCNTHKIPLVRIPYWDMDNGKYKEILTNIIKG